MRGLALSVTMLLAVMALAACGSSAPPGAQATAAAPSTTEVPPQLAVPAGQRAVLTATVERGSQIYACHAGAWVLKQPAAALTAPTTAVLHDAGPRWTATADGSSVTGAQVASVPVPGSAADLLVRATGHDGQGVMATVDFVQRLGVQGGAPPAGACTEGAQQAVGYTAEYRFYAPG
ncbi:MAG TPA: DUF3455 domain-containing protein [Pseudonocardia sp.]|nr:DUF3455 domain-containing protein [Pseudonocardia sp.]